MLAAIRKFAKSWVAAIIIGLLIISFAIFGFNNDPFANVGGDRVVAAGDRVLTSADFRREYDGFRRQLEQQSGQAITPELAAQNNLEQRVLSQLVARESFGALLSRLGIRPSDKLLVDEIQNIQAFFDPISGRFDRRTFEQRLSENGMTPKRFDAILRDDLAGQHLQTAIGHGLIAPRAYGAMAAIFGLESRDIAWLTVTPQTVPPPPAPTDAQLTALMKENAAQLTRPETRVLTLVRFSPASVPAAGPIDEAELKKRYDFRRDTLSKPETRSFVQIPAKDQATAQQIVARLGRNEDPAAIAKSLGVDPIVYQERPRTAVADRRLGEQVFKLQAGQVAPVQGELGLAVVKVLSVTPGQSITLEQARPMLEAEIRKDQAAERVYALTEAYEKAHQGGASLPEAAQAAGVPALTLGPITAQGVNAQGQPIPGLDARLLEQAFSLPSGGESELIDLGNGEYAAVRVERVTAAALPPLAELRPQLARAWTLREIARRMEARANELAARVRKGETLEAVAGSAGLTVNRADDITRQSAGQIQTVSRELLGRGLEARQGEVFVGRTQEFGFGVAQVSDITMVAGPPAAQIAEQQRQAMTQTLFREVFETAQQAAQQKLKVKVDRNRARAAVGLEPIAPPGKAEPKS